MGLYPRPVLPQTAAASRSPACSEDRRFAGRARPGGGLALSGKLTRLPEPYHQGRVAVAATPAEIEGVHEMLPAPFEYDRPETLEEALQLLAEHGEDAKVLAGGQSLIPLMKLRFAAPERLIDVNRIAGLDGIEERDGFLRIGALVRHNQLASSDVIKDRYPTIAAAAPMISDPIVRNLGTIGGSLAHADPSGDLGSVMLALGATVVVRSTRRRARDRGDGPGRRALPELDRSDRAAHRDPRAVAAALDPGGRT